MHPIDRHNSKRHFQIEEHLFFLSALADIACVFEKAESGDAPEIREGISSQRLADRTRDYGAERR